jgi:glycerol-3-phosphate dehydrogenase subunit B
VTAVVVGGGLAGAAAALTLAERGVEVTLVRAGPGATALGWGAVDVAGASPDPGGLPWRDPVRGEPLSPAERLGFLLRSRFAHPYAALFPEGDPERAVRAARDAAVALDAWLRPEGLGLGGGLDASLLLANVRGALRVADLATADVAAGDVGSAESLVLADVPGLPGYDPRAAARLLAGELAALGLPSRPIRVAPLALPDALLAEASRPAWLAAALDAPDAVPLLAQAVAPLAARESLILLPPVVGLARTLPLLAAASERAGCPVAELLGAPPWSPAGLRLDRALLAALGRAGVSLVEGHALGLDLEAERAAAVEVERADGGRERLVARAVVLATGRFCGGGLVESGDRVRESLLDLPVYDDRGRRLDGEPARRSLRRRYADPQPLFSGGIRVDGRLRPVGADGRPARANVLAAGELVGGFDPAICRTGLGFALLSGRRAGEEASRLVAEAASA